MVRSIPPEAALLLMGFLTFFFLIAAFLCLRGLPRSAWSLITVGLLTTLLATFVGFVSPAASVNLGGQGHEMISVGSGASSSLGWVGILLILGGVTLCVLDRLGFPKMPAYRDRDEGIREAR
jgi:hypothetical protein